jgi:hypothetical protein
VWEAPGKDRNSKFHLVGINNQNFIMQDEETGSWWQQITGEAIFGASKGQQLKSVHHDEVSFSLWKKEQPNGRILRPDDSKPWKQFSENWEEHTGKLPVLAALNPDTRLSARTLIVGLKIGGVSKAYPFSTVQEQNPIMDFIGDTPVILVVAEDKKSVRAFDRRLDGRALEFFAKPNSQTVRLLDAETGSEWDFTGTSIAGPQAGKKLKQIYVLNDYWFDWKTYNPATEIYR